MTQSVTRGAPARIGSSQIETFHQHSALHRGIMLDWLRHCDEVGEPHPSNEVIAARFDLPIEAARTLLADLADRGEIRIVYARGERQITLAPPKPKRDLGTPRALPPSVRRPSKPIISEEECLARIKRTLSRSKAPAEVKPQAAAPSPAAVPKEPPMPAPAHCPSSAAKPVQINFRPQPGHVDRVVAMAAAEGVPMTAVARRIFERGMAAEDEPVALTGKPMVPAAVLRAANEAGVDLHEFCSTLLRIGLAAFDRGER